MKNVCSRYAGPRALLYTEGTRLDDGSNLSAKTKRIIYARWQLLETNFGGSPF